jgi:thymidylate synthase ThyX
VGYGHTSVAEHAVLHIAMENISRRAVEALESCRLASFTEKSSRYQVYSSDLFLIPPELSGHPLEKQYLKICRDLFEAYEKNRPAMEKAALEMLPQQESENENTWQRRTQGLARDICRYYLPTSTLANVGMTINARALEHVLCKLLSHPLREMREIGAEIKSIAQAKIPTLVKYASENPCLIEAQNEFIVEKEYASRINTPAKWLDMLAYDRDGESRVLAALLFRYGHKDFNQCLQKVKGLDDKERSRLTHALLGKLSEHDIPLRELEYAGISLAVTLDQGCFGELKRHRMMTLTPQSFTPAYGYAMPKLGDNTNLESSFRILMDDAKTIFDKIATSINPDVAAYLLPHAYNRRILLKMNLRSAYHLLKLRTAARSHFAIRRVTCRLSEEIKPIYPLFAPYFGSQANETSAEIEKKYFIQTE